MEGAEKATGGSSYYEGATLQFPEASEWECHLFGGGNNRIVWRPVKGQEPNRFWRWMQYLAFGNRWTRRPL